MLRKVGISLVKFLIILVVASLVFSSLIVDFPVLIKGIMVDVFEHSSDDSKAQVLNDLRGSCSVLDEGGSVVSAIQVCSNQELLDEMKATCTEYRKFKESGGLVENDEQLAVTCEKLESGEIDDACEGFKGNGLSSETTDVSNICEDYDNGNLDDGDFFAEFITSPLGNQELEMPNINFLTAYNRIIRYLNSNKAIYFVSLAILLIILFFLINNWKFYLIMLGDILFSLGILIILPYLIIIGFDTFIGFDTTPVLDSFFGPGNGLEARSVVSVGLLLLMRIYTGFIIKVGFVFVALGIAGKLGKHYLNKKTDR
jgi:hypothetical protein